MRHAVIAVVGALLLLVVAAPAPARVRDDDVRTAALDTLKTNVHDAMLLEKNALALSEAGEKGKAEAEIKQSLTFLEGASDAAKFLTTSPMLAPYAKNDPWNNLSSDLESAIKDDRKAADAAPRRQGYLDVHYYLFQAAGWKDDIYKLVNGEVQHPMCTELINLQGPIMVNGVPQGQSQLSVDFSCTHAIKMIYIALPTSTVTQAVPDGTSKDVVLQAGRVIEVMVNGAKSGGVTFETDPPAAQGVPVDAIVPIAGDSYVDNFPEIM